MRVRIHEHLSVEDNLRENFSIISTDISDNPPQMTTNQSPDITNVIPEEDDTSESELSKAFYGKQHKKPKGITSKFNKAFLKSPSLEVVQVSAEEVEAPEVLNQVSAEEVQVPAEEVEVSKPQLRLVNYSISSSELTPSVASFLYLARLRVQLVNSSD